jgi:hypothetical protein
MKRLQQPLNMGDGVTITFARTSSFPAAPAWRSASSTLGTFTLIRSGYMLDVGAFLCTDGIRNAASRNLCNGGSNSVENLIIINLARY